MRLAAVEARVLDIPFKVSFKHASAERTAMQSLWVEARTAAGVVGVGEGCPREYVTGESLATSAAFVAAHRDDWIGRIADADGLERWVEENEPLIDANPAAWSAVEIACLDALGREDDVPIEGILGIPPLQGTFQYTGVIGDGPQAAFEAQLAHYRKAGFRAFKVKLSGDPEADLGKVRALRASGVEPGAVRADANNLFRDAAAAIAHLSPLDYPFFALEEPLRTGDYTGMREVGSALDTRVILDESALRVGQLAALRGDAERWIVNLRISKMGGLLRSLAFARAAKDAGFPLVIGAHVGETSVLTRAALAVASFARDQVIAQEGAFGTHLLERDVVDPPLMFGAGGRLDADGLLGPGLGLRLA